MNIKGRKLWICPFAIITALLIFSGGCNKDSADGRVLKPGSVTDIDGNVYRTFIIGNQEWMAENLKTTRYNDGTSVKYPGTDNGAWESNTSGAYSWYNNDQAGYGGTYGALYNWHAVNTGKLCPSGWRVPSDDDWTKVTRFLIAGTEVKSSSDSLQFTDTGPADANGFNALPGGVRFSSLPGGSRAVVNGYYYYIGETGRWWTSTGSSPAYAWYRSIYPDTGNVYRSDNYKENGFSVRCVRN
jgi:uncharacterized protein (TIGR02145 family)